MYKNISYRKRSRVHRCINFFVKIESCRVQNSLFSSSYTDQSLRESILIVQCGRRWRSSKRVGASTISST